MSLPKIPDINIETDSDIEKSISLIISSIAMEEISLSKLLDAETNKLLHILNKKNVTASEIIDINNSIDQIVKDIINLQILLQFKLENISKMLICTEPCISSAEAEPSATETCAKNTADCMCACTQRGCQLSSENRGCCVEGKGIGYITNCVDEFYCKKAFAEVFASTVDLRNSFIRYKIINENSCLFMDAFINDIIFNSDAVIFKGEGKCIRKLEQNNEVVGPVRFIFIIKPCGNGCHVFDMIIMSTNLLLQHRSGTVEANCEDSNFKINCFS